jgi:hypothetical protein
MWGGDCFMTLKRVIDLWLIGYFAGVLLRALGVGA